QGSRQAASRQEKAARPAACQGSRNTLRSESAWRSPIETASVNDQKHESDQRRLIRTRSRCPYRPPVQGLCRSVVRNVLSPRGGDVRSAPRRGQETRAELGSA